MPAGGLQRVPPCVHFLPAKELRETRPAHHLRGGVAEDPFRPPVEHRDDAVAIGREDGELGHRRQCVLEMLDLLDQTIAPVTFRRDHLKRAKEAHAAPVFELRLPDRTRPDRISPRRDQFQFLVKGRPFGDGPLDNRRDSVSAEPLLVEAQSRLIGRHKVGPDLMDLAHDLGPVDLARLHLQLPSANPGYPAGGFEDGLEARRAISLAPTADELFFRDGHAGWSVFGPRKDRSERRRLEGDPPRHSIAPSCPSRGR